MGPITIPAIPQALRPQPCLLKYARSLESWHLNSISGAVEWVNESHRYADAGSNE